MTPDEIVTAIASQGGFDTTTEDASSAVLLSWANQARDEALSETKYRKALVSLGPTVAGQAEYAVPENVVDLRQLRVDASRPWIRVGLDQMWQAEGGTYSLNGAPGAFAASFEADADATVRLLPAPEESGKTIEALAAVLPDAMLAGGTELSVGLPREMHQPICVDGGIAIGMRRVKRDPEGAAEFRATWQDAADELRRRANSRIGHGATQIRLER